MARPSARARASTIGCQVVNNAAVQTKRDCAIVAQLPDPLLWIPRSTCPLHAIAEPRFDEGDTQFDDLVGGDAGKRRLPIAFGDEELNGLGPLLPLRIVAIAYADEAVTVLLQRGG